MESANISHRLVNLLMYILTSGVLHLQIGLILAQDSPNIVLTPSTGTFDNIPVGSAISINCTITIPVGYLIGTTGVPSAVIWETEKAKVELTSNNTVLTEDVRISVNYYEVDNSLSFQLTISDVDTSDSGLFTCHTYVSHSIETPVHVSETVYLSVGNSLMNDTPHCCIAPGEVILEDLSIKPTCFVNRNTDVDKTVWWTMQYPDGSIKNIFDSAVKDEGLNYESYHFEVDAVKPLDDGMRYICNVMVVDSNHGNTSVNNCTTDALDVISGATMNSRNLSHMSIGETLSVTAEINLPIEFHVSMTTWSKVINGVHQMIIQDDTVNDDMVDADRYSVQKVISDNHFKSTMTISDVKSTDDGYYACYLVVSSHPDLNIGNGYLRTFRIRVVNVPTTPEITKETSRSRRTGRWLTSIKVATGILIVMIAMVVITGYVKQRRR